MTSSTPAPPSGSPATLSSWFAICLAGIGWSVTVPYSLHGTVIASIGWLLLALALLVGDRTALTTGAGGLVFGAFVAAGDGAQLAVVLVGVTAAVLAWDVGQNGLSIGRQLGREAATARAELAHVLASLAAGSCIVTAGYVASSVAIGTQPIIAVVFLLLAAGLVTIALGPRTVLEFDLPD